METLEKDILESVSIICKQCKRSDAESIPIHLSYICATNITMEVVEDSIRLLIAIISYKQEDKARFGFLLHC